MVRGKVDKIDQLQKTSAKNFAKMQKKHLKNGSLKYGGKQLNDIEPKEIYVSGMYINKLITILVHYLNEYHFYYRV